VDFLELKSNPRGASGITTQPVYVLRLSVVGVELNLHVLPRDLYRMHVSARASVHETVAMTDGVVGESLIAEPNVAPSGIHL